jgi:hypothetical protein
MKALALLLLSSIATAGTVHLRPYFDPEGTEVILVWDEASGTSRSWYFDAEQGRFTRSSAQFQLPAKIGLSGKVMMAPYLDSDGSEVVLIWEPATGKSVSWYFEKSESRFKKSEPGFQLPRQKGGEMMMAPYLAKDGSEVVLVWDARTGKSWNWYFDKEARKFKLSEPGFQLPPNLGLPSPVMMQPYMSKDGEVIQTWSSSTGQSINWYFDDAEKKYQRSEAKFQLPRNPGVTGDVRMFPYLAHDKSEVMLVWSGASGASVSWYFDDEKAAFVRSPAGFQLPATPLGPATVLVPYIDTAGTEVILAAGPNGKSKGYFHDDDKNKMVPAAPGYQLPPDPLK